MFTTPQSYPLVMIRHDYERWLIVGWSRAGLPVGVPYGSKLPNMAPQPLSPADARAWEIPAPDDIATIAIERNDE